VRRKIHFTPLFKEGIRTFAGRAVFIQQPPLPLFYMIYKLPLLLLLTVAIQRLSAQTPDPVLTPEDAVRIALEHNFDIRFSQTDAEIAKVNNTKGNAGMLPLVNFVAGENFTVSAFDQKAVNGSESKALAAPFNTVNAGVQLSWTLFDGRRMFITKKKLEEIEALGQLNLKSQIQQSTAAVLQSYYDVVRGRLQEKALAEVIALNEERLRIAEAKLAAGFAAQTDALQARIDLNQRKSDLLGQQNATLTSKRALNVLLARDQNTRFDVQETLVNTIAPDRAALLQKLGTQNPVLQSLQKNADVAALAVDENRTLNKPRIVGIGQFNGQRADNGAGFFKNTTQIGLTLGASLVIPLYTAGNYNRQVQTAELQAKQALIQVNQLRLVTETDLDNQLSYFQTQQEMFTLEEDNVKNARESLRVSTERFRLGQTNALETQTAQNTLEQALFRRNLVQYNLKTTELRLRLIAGEL
jgi:outer membrane protein TolC